MKMGLQRNVPETLRKAISRHLICRNSQKRRKPNARVRIRGHEKDSRTLSRWQKEYEEIMKCSLENPSPPSRTLYSMLYLFVLLTMTALPSGISISTISHTGSVKDSPILRYPQLGVKPMISDRTNSLIQNLMRYIHRPECVLTS